jgi:hypothetical protein
MQTVIQTSVSPADSAVTACFYPISSSTASVAGCRFACHLRRLSPGTASVAGCRFACHLRRLSPGTASFAVPVFCRAALDAPAFHLRRFAIRPYRWFHSVCFCVSP